MFHADVGTCYISRAQTGDTIHFREWFFFRLDLAQKKLVYLSYIFVFYIAYIYLNEAYLCNPLHLSPIDVHALASATWSTRFVLKQVYIRRIVLMSCLSILYICTYFLSALYLILVCAFLYHLHCLISLAHQANLETLWGTGSYGC